MKILKFLPLILLLLLLTSCVGAEPDNIAYVTAMGIDRSDQGYLYTIQFAQPTKISGGSSEGGGSVGNIVENITVEAPTIYSAINVADTIISKDLSLSHSKVFVISEEVAKEGLNNINDVIIRNNDIRPDMYISIAENAGKYLEEVEPAIELNPVKYYQLTYENKNGSAIPQNNAFEFYSACISGTRDCLLPLAGIARSAESDEAEPSSEESEPIENIRQQEAAVNPSEFETGTRNYFAGETGKRIKNKSEVLGSAVFKGDKYIGKIGSTETELHNILMDHFSMMNVNFYCEDSPNEPITLQIEEYSPPKYDIDIENKTADIYVSLRSELLCAPADHRYDSRKTDKAMSKMVNDAEEKFLYKLYTDMGTDILGIKGKLKRYFLTNNEYEDYCAAFDPTKWSFRVHTDLKIKRTGMTYYY